MACSAAASWILLRRIPGDPLTPGVGATADAKRLSVKEAKSITKIPVLPISYGDAQPLLAALKGPMAPEDWRGSLPIPYHVGPGPAKVHLKVEFNWDIKPVNDVIAKIPGSVAPDEWIIRGNHHDAWVNGAEDPVSGQAPLLEEARALGDLLKQGWKPRRTIIYAAWDGEEPMLLGSTEWVEAHADELRQHAAVYINTDGNDRGLLNMGGSHSLEQFINGVARDIEDPETKLTVWQRLQLVADRRRQVRGRPQRTAAACRLAHRRARLGHRLHRISRSSRDRYSRPRLRRRGRAGHLPLDLRRLSTGTRIFPTAISSTAGLCRRR